MYNENFVCMLRALCIAYDNKYETYRESEYEGISLFEFFLANGVVELPTFNSKHHQRAWEAMLQRG